MHAAATRRPIRTLFISDVHMGMRGAQVDALLAFLETVEAETIYLVGDIVDGWRLRKSWYWPPACNRLVQVLLGRLRRGVRIVYIPGNHDGFLRDFAALRFGGVEVRDSMVHQGVDGRRFLVIHGDQFDVVVRHAHWVTSLGNFSYNAALRIAMVVNRLRRRMGRPHWSLSAWARANVGRAAALVTRFEVALSRAAHERGYDGVICGHIHSAANHDRHGVTYLNCGDWVEHCTALVETHDGRFELVAWNSQADRIMPPTKTESREVADAAAAHRH